MLQSYNADLETVSIKVYISSAPLSPTGVISGKVTTTTIDVKWQAVPGEHFHNEVSRPTLSAII